MSVIEVKKRSKCRICGEHNLLNLFSLKDMPLADGFKKVSSIENEFLYDIDIYQCQKCNTVQTLHDISYKDYYSDYAYTVGESKMASNFMKKLAETTFKKYSLKNGCKVIEIGSADGSQLLCFKNLGAKVFGFEPSEELCSVSRNIGVPVYEGLFELNSESDIPKEYKNAEVVLLTYTFDHIPEPIQFLEAVKRILDTETGLLIIEVHDLDKILERTEFCLFEHEHTVYMSLDTLKNALELVGFKIISTELLAEHDRRGNSLMIVATDRQNTKYNNDGIEIYNNDVYDLTKHLNFKNKLYRSIEKLDEFVMKNVKLGKKIAGYGAGGRGIMTLATMKSANNLQYLCDNNTSFQGFVTPKTHIPIVAPTDIAINPVDILLVFSYGYIDEIRDQLKEIKSENLEIISLLDLL